MALTAEQHLALLEEGARVACVGSFVWEVGGESVWSDELFRLAGLEPVDGVLTIDDFLAFVHPDDRARLGDVYAGVPGEEDTHREFRIVRRDGTVRFVRGGGVAVRDADGRFVRYVGSIIDVTERRLAEARAELWRHALEESQRIGGIGTFVVVPATREIQWSPGLYRINGVSPDVPAGPETGIECVHPDDRERQRAWFGQIVARGTADPIQVRVVHAGGGVRHVVGHGAKVRLADGVERVIGTAIDVTDRIALEEQLRHAAKMEAIGTLAAGVAHDFNNYLTVITATLGLIERSLPGDQAERLADVHHAVDRCASLTRALLAFARRQPSHPRRIDLREVVQTAGRMLERVLGERVALALELPREPVAVEADPAHLEQVVVNLATNARDAMPGGGRLTVRVAVEDGAASEEARAAGLARAAVLEVADEGVGIPEAMLAHVFDPYFTTKQLGTGTGLGLATVYGTVRQNLGSITVRSEMGRGTTFTVRLPLREGAAEQQAARGEGAAVASEQGRGRVLLVEDMPELRRVLAGALRDAGYEAVEAGDGVAALEVLKRAGAVDVVVSDVVMPRMGGVELAAEVARRAPGTPVVLMSGYADANVLQGAQVRLSKPFEMRELVEAVAEAVAGRAGVG